MNDRQRLPRNYFRVNAEPDEGSAAAYLVVFMIVVVALAGLLLDGGAALAARSEAASIAQQAARAGADTLTARSLRGGGAPAIDPGAAADAARAVLTSVGVNGDIDVTPTQVTVTVHQTHPASILSAVGIDTVGGSATATANALQGATEGH